jgi:prevent-host-death family protein
MKFVTVRDLRGHPGEVWKKLAADKDLVLTNNGKPVALLTEINEDSLEDALGALRSARALAALDQIQAASKSRGLDKMSLKAINAEIGAARKSGK